MSMTGFPANVGTKDNPVWGVKMKQAASPGDVVSVTTKAGKPIGSKRLISVHKEWADAVDWVAEDCDSNGAGGAQSATGPTGLGPSAAPVNQGSPPASFGAGPIGPATASALVEAQIEAMSRYRTAGVVDAQALASLANTIVIAIQRGAENDLILEDPFGG